MRPCRTREAGLQKTSVQHMLTAVAITVVRVDAFLAATPRGRTRQSALACPGVLSPHATQGSLMVCSISVICQQSRENGPLPLSRGAQIKARWNTGEGKRPAPAVRPIKATTHNKLDSTPIAGKYV